MKLADIKNASDTVKAALGALTSIVVVLAGTLGWMIVTFETTAAAEQKWASHNQAIACKTVYDLKRERRERIAELSQVIATAKIEAIKQAIKGIDEDIKRIDPNGKC